MERSEPSLVPEWLRSKGGGGSSHHFVSSQADKRSSSNSQRSSSSNGSSNRHDKNPYSRSYNSSSRNQCSKDREKLGDGDTWGFEYSDPLTNFIGRRSEKGSLGRSKSMISRRGGESLQPRNRSHNIDRNGNETLSVGSVSTGTQVSFEIDFPSFRSDERYTTPDVIRVPSPGLSRGVQGLSIRGPPMLGNEGWTSSLAKVTVGAVGSNIACSPYGFQQPSDTANDPSALTSASTSSDVRSNGLVQAHVQSLSVPQPQRFEELSFVGNKKLIPMTSSVPQKMVLNPSDKLKPKTAARSIDGVTGPKNGTPQISTPQLGSPTVRSSAFKDIPGVVPNGSSTGVPSLSSIPLKNANNMKHHIIPVVDKRLSRAQLRSRNDFLNLMRKKSLASSSADGDPCTVVSSSMQNLDESKETACDSVGPSENGDENCNGVACNMAKNCFDFGKNVMSHNEVIHTAEELDFLRALGWEDDTGDDEGLTEEEINAFVNKYMTSKQGAKLPRGLQLKMVPGPNSQGLCTASASSELSTSNTQM